MSEVRFVLNGRAVVVADPDPGLLLLDYLRSPAVALTGAKKGCGQGGCGACTVIVSEPNQTSGSPRHSAINSCLRPVCALDGLSVTTVEGTGEVIRPAPLYQARSARFSRSAAAPATVTPAEHQAHAEGREFRTRPPAERVAADSMAARSLAGAMNPVAHRLALNNGTQCGFCSVGWVMTMSAFLAERPDATKREIEDALDGNLCRCTGYRSILTAMKTFASDWSDTDEKNRMICYPESTAVAQHVRQNLDLPFPATAIASAQPVTIRGTRSWLTATTVDELVELVAGHPRRSVRLVHGNTSYGVYPQEVDSAEVLIDIRHIDELATISHHESHLSCGAGVRYADVIEALAADSHVNESGNFAAAHFMARRTAGAIVRNAASLGGNTMLVLSHIADGVPFPSDLATALVAIGAEVEWIELSTRRRHRASLEALIANCVAAVTRFDDVLLLRYHLPRGETNGVALAQKVALREVNSHAIVNAATRFELAGDVISGATIVFGGLAPYPWLAQATAAALVGRPLSLGAFENVAATLEGEVRQVLDAHADRMAQLPDEGFSDAYRLQLAVGFVYKSIVHALLHLGDDKVEDAVRSSGQITWGRWQVSDGTQEWEAQDFTAPVGRALIKLAAFEQTSGQTHYTHDLSVPPTCYEGAFVQSSRALANFHLEVPGSSRPADVSQVRAHLADRFASFVDLITHEEIPAGGINFQGMGSDQPLFAVDRVHYAGQAIALVLAADEKAAQEIAVYAGAHCVGYDEVTDWPAEWRHPVLSLQDAIERGSVFPDQPASAPFASHLWKITRPGSSLDWVAAIDPGDRRVAKHESQVDGVECMVAISSVQSGAQVHFYMETQSAVVLPKAEGRLHIHPSSQSPAVIHGTAAMALGVEYNQIEVAVPQVGGGFGGKTEQSRFVAGPAAVAAAVTGRPVRVAMERGADTAMLGHRHPYYGQCQVALDTGASVAENRGLIRGLNARMWADGGAFYDCSFIVSNNVQLRTDGPYRIPNFNTENDVCRTNTAPNTAMRAFGDIQSKLITETAIDDAAFALGMQPEDVREKNLYESGDVTPFGQALTYCYMGVVWKYLKTKSDFTKQKQSVADFNDANRWRKQGIALLPVKYGSGYNLVAIEQSTAILSVYAADGSLVVHQGGVDMGQGVTTQVHQIAAYVLDIPMNLIRVEQPNTAVVPNPTSTGGSTGTAYNGEAVRQACELLRSRLVDFGYKMRDRHGDEWCAGAGIDFWNHSRLGWQTMLGSGGDQKLIWQNLVSHASAERVDLVVSVNALITGGTESIPGGTYKPRELQPSIPGAELAAKEIADRHPPGRLDAFCGFTYSGACVVVEIDVLTGEQKIIRADLVYDMGWSLNPAIDIGQVEGAFMQGIGYVLTEQMVIEPNGDERGRANSVNTWGYKLPATSTVPLQMNTYLFPRSLASHIPESPHGLFSSKEVGEAPLVLATAAFLAVKAAIRASRVERGLDGLFHLDAPATVQEISRALEVSPSDMSQRETSTE